jgi:large subunit ribosomal protein LX
MTEKGAGSIPRGKSVRVKVFRVTGQIKKPNLQTSFHKEIRATKPEDVTERIYKELGSKHRAKRFQIRIDSIKEIEADEVQDATIRKLTLGEKGSVQ